MNDNLLIFYLHSNENVGMSIIIFERDFVIILFVFNFENENKLNEPKMVNIYGDFPLKAFLMDKEYQIFVSQINKFYVEFGFNLFVKIELKTLAL